MQLFNRLQFLYNPEDNASSAPDTKSTLDILDETPTEEAAPEPDKEEKEETETEKEDILAEGEGEAEPEEIEIEDVEPEPEPEKLELTTPVSRKAILKEYPDLFKKFPYLETAYYREQQYTQILPTIEDAKQAAAKAETFDRIEKVVLNGDTEVILKSIKDADEKAFNTVVDNYLGTLSKIDKNAYLHVVSGVVKSTIKAMVTQARSSGNNELEQAAAALNQFVYGSTTFEEQQRYGPGKDSENTPEAQKVNQEREAFIRERFEVTRDELASKAQNSIKSTIALHIDPKGMMTDYVKRVAIQDALRQVENSLEQDQRFRIVLDKLWENAFRSNFSRASAEAIRSAYLGKAKTLLAPAIQKARGEALKGLGKRITEEQAEPARKGHVPVGKATAQVSSKSMKPGEKTLDFFMRD